MGERGRKASGATTAVPRPEVTQDALDIEGLVRAIAADARNLDGAAGERAGDERRAGRKQEATASDRRGRCAGETESRVPDVCVPGSRERARGGAGESAVGRGEVVLVSIDRVLVGLRGESSGRRREGDQAESEEDEHSPNAHGALLPFAGQARLLQV